MSTASFHRPLAELIADCDGITTVRELLHRLVHAEMAQASERWSERRSILPLSLEELERLLGLGRAGSADLPIPQKIDSYRAFEVVMDAFKDGLILLYVDERRCMRLDESLEAGAGSKVMLIRRTMLTG